ncbi:MAG: alpha/beta fold hydrolase [Acidobacteriia bacterium]|nr:alpha/beta fold hydrolase [Terriglobia bacterium]
MNRNDRILATGGVLLLAAGAILSTGEPAPQQIWMHTESCHVPATWLPARQPSNRILVFHGLSANRRLMLTLGAWLHADNTSVYLFDLPGHGDHPAPFSFQRAEQCAAEVVEALATRDDPAGHHTALLGHSMGGGIVVRLADQLPTAATIAISPGLGGTPRRMPVNLLILTGDFDIPQLQRQARKLLEAAGGTRTAPEDFVQRRAAELVRIPRATHSSYLLDAEAAALMRSWLARSLPDYRPASDLPSRRRLWGLLSGLFGLLFLYTVLAARFARWLRRTSPAQPVSVPVVPALVGWALAALLAVAALHVWLPLGWLRLYDGDYLASYLFVVGSILVVLQTRGKRILRAATEGRPAPLPRPSALRHEALPALGGALAGVTAMLAFGAWLNWTGCDLWLNAPRWWRFAALLPFLLPYFAAEERVLGAPSAEWRGELRRYAQFALLRSMLAVALLVPIFLLGRGPVLALLLLPYAVLLSLLQRLAADQLRRHANSAAAACCFSVILMAWLMAAILPIT